MKRSGLITTKIGMTRLYDDAGVAHPVTVLSVGDCTVIGNRTKEKNGYIANILGLREAKAKHVAKPQLVAAEKAGVKAGDIVVGLGGYEVENVTDLTRALRKFKSGDTTEIVVFRSGAEVKLSITLDEKPNDTSATAPNEAGQGKMPESGSYDEWHDYFFGDKD